MTDKPDGKTWFEYIYSDEFTDEERDKILDDFFGGLADEARQILVESHLDETVYEIEVNKSVDVQASGGWMMDEQEDAEETRDVLAGHGIGDESVGVYVSPRSSEGEIVDIPPDHVPVDEYTVHVKLRRNQAITEAALSGAKDRLNETMMNEMDGG